MANKNNQVYVYTRHYQFRGSSSLFSRGECEVFFRSFAFPLFPFFLCFLLLIFSHPRYKWAKCQWFSNRRQIFIYENSWISITSILRFFAINGQTFSLRSKGWRYARRWRVAIDESVFVTFFLGDGDTLDR